MNVQAALTQLAGFREGKANDARILKAQRAIENDADARARLAEQIAFDAHMGAMLGAIRVPEDLRQRLDKAQEGAAPKGSRQGVAASLAVVLGLLVIIGLLIFFHLEANNHFPGSENLAKLVLTPKSMSGFEMEPVQKNAGALGDWFYMRGFEGFQVPPELRKAAALGSRVFKSDGRQVAQIALDLHDSVVYVVRPAEFGVQLPADGEWRVFEEQDWVAAARNSDGLCALVTFRGTEGEMRDFLKTLGP